MKIRKINIYVGMGIIIVPVLVACGIHLYKVNTEKKDMFIIGMSQANLYEPWRIEMNKEIQDEEKKHSNIKVIYKDAGDDPEKQKEDIEDLINFGADLLILSVDDSKELNEAMSKAHKVVPVILLDRAEIGYDYSMYIGTDNRSIGIQAGELIKELAGENKVNIIEIQGVLDSNVDKEITSGFKSVIGKCRNIIIDRTIVGNWQKNETQDKLEEILKEDKSVNIIFAHDDYMALGAYYATQNMKANNIKIIGIDGINGHERGVELVKDGMLQCTFTRKTGGKEAIEYALKILNKEEVPSKIILKSSKITKDILKN